MAFKKILCPVDFSEGSARAMRVAVRIAKESGAELVLFHAWNLPATSGEYAFADGVIQDLADASQANLDETLGDAKALGATHVSTKLVNGVGWAAIVETLADRSFDLVVMGTHGRTGLRRFVLGSVAEKVVREAPCPVMTVRLEGELRPFQNLLVPVDFSQSSHDALKLAAQLIAPDGKGITLLHIVEVPVAYRGELTIPGVGEVLDKNASDQLERWAGELRGLVNVPVKTQWNIGWPGPEIIATAEQERAYDLVVMGSHGRTGIKRALIGSVAEKVVRYAPCPVVVARKPRAEHE